MSTSVTTPPRSKKFSCRVRPGSDDARASVFAAGQRVQQRGFADIRPAGEGDFRPGDRRQLLQRLRAKEESALARRTAGARLPDGRIVCRQAAPRRRQVAMRAAACQVRASDGLASLVLRWISHCCATESVLFQLQ